MIESTYPQCIHKWMKHQHELRLGVPHPLNDLEWSMSLVTDDPKVLHNSNQKSTVDCALHTCIVPVLKADDRPLGLLGNNENEAKLAGVLK